MKSFKQYNETLNEGFTKKGEATFVEEVIIHCINTYNFSRGDKNKFIELSKKDKEILKFIEEHSKKIKISNEIDQGLADLYLFGKTLHQKIGSDASAGAESAGKTSPRTSNWWATITGKPKDISKADILIGSRQVSVKKSKAQLMSGTKKEALATLEAAFEESKLNDEIQAEIISAVEKFADTTRTEGAEMTAGELSKLNIDDIKSEVNLKARKIYDDAQEVSTKVESIIKNASENKIFKNAFAYEAMTGWEKFAGKTFNSPGDEIGFADSMLMVDDSLSRVIFQDVQDPNGPLVNAVAKKMKIKVGMKSSSIKQGPKDNKKKVGYSFAQVVRLAVDTAFNDSDALQESYQKEVDKLKGQLNEGYINENAFMDNVKKLGNKLKKSISLVWKIFLEKIKKITETVKKYISGGFSKIMDFFDIEYDVRAYVTL